MCEAYHDHPAILRRTLLGIDGCCSTLVRRPVRISRGKLESHFSMRHRLITSDNLHKNIQPALANAEILVTENALSSRAHFRALPVKGHSEAQLSAVSPGLLNDESAFDNFRFAFFLCIGIQLIRFTCLPSLPACLPLCLVT